MNTRIAPTDDMTYGFILFTLCRLENFDVSITMNPNELIQRIQHAIPDASVQPSGEGCSFNVQVVSQSFADESLIKRHRRVMAAAESPSILPKLP